MAKRKVLGVLELGGMAKALQKKLQKDAEESIRVAMQWLVGAMKALVSVQCGAASSHKMSTGEKREHNRRRTMAFDKKHSPDGQPPYMETGAGRESIDWAPIPGGAALGTRSMGIPKMAGGNYMFGWDTKEGIRGFHHPWASLFFVDKRYKKEFMSIFWREMKKR